MSEDWGANNDFLGWHKWKLGWLDPSQVNCARTPGTTQYTLTPLERPGGDGTRLVFVPSTAAPATPSNSAPATATTRRCAAPAS